MLTGTGSAMVSSTSKLANEPMAMNRSVVNLRPQPG